EPVFRLGLRDLSRRRRDPMDNGRPTVCVPDPQAGGCVSPFHDPSLVNEGGPHGYPDAMADIDGGRMDGFVASALEGRHGFCAQNPFSPDCTQYVGRKGQPDAMGWHDAREIPNYWAYARNFVLQDHMFEPNASWSLPAHLFMVSAWSAKCSVKGDPQSCVSDIQGPYMGQQAGTNKVDYAWPDLT